MATLKGTNKADKITGTAADDIITGDNGNDALFGGAGNDRIDGGNGEDSIDGGAGDDRIDGGNGNDMLSGGGGNDEIVGGNGQDVLVLAGNRADYSFTLGDNGAVLVRDRRPGGIDGTDRLTGIELVQLADGRFKLADLVSAPPVNAAPVAVDDALTVAEDAGATDVTALLLANDKDADGDSFKVSAVQAVSQKGASVTVSPTGQVSYNPGTIFADLDAGETATDSFTYTITDAAGLTSTATATVTITGVTQNTAPTARADQLTLTEDAGATDVTAQLLANDSDPEGDAFKVSAVQAVSEKGAAVTVSPTGQVSYNPGNVFADLDPGETATDSFTYTITDAGGLTSTATATVTITGVASNEAPYAGADQLTISEDAGATDVTDQLLANDFDPEGDELAVSAVQAVSDKGATVSVTVDGKVLYDPGQIFAGLMDGDTATDTFTYTVTDTGGRTSTATATVTITGVTPAADYAFSIEEDATSWDLLENMEDLLDMDIVGVDTQSVLGTVFYDGEMLTFTADHKSSDRLNGDQVESTFFTVKGANGESKVIQARIYGVNDDVVAVDDSVSVAEGQTSANLWKTLLANDIDVDDVAWAREILGVDTTGTQGSVFFDAAKKTLTYSAAGIDLAPGETITDSFTYRVDDNNHGSFDTATVTVTVIGAEGGPLVSSSHGNAPMSAFVAGDAAGLGGGSGMAMIQPEILAGDMIIG